MNIRFYVACALFFPLFLFSSCDWGGSEDEMVTPNLRALHAHEQEMVFASSRFALDLFQQLQKKDDPNQFYSPYSIHQALSMAMNGNEGEVLEEFNNVLRFEGMSLEEANEAAESLTKFLLELDPKVRLSIANAIWYKQEFEANPNFEATVRNSFKAEVAGLDMANPQSVDVINNWIENNTEGLIKDMLDAIPSTAVMYLVNAIYFKADWKYRFNSANTHKAPFYVTPQQVVEVEMMSMNESAPMRNYTTEGLEYLEIPYSTGHYNMGVITGTDLDTKLQDFSFEDLENWREQAFEANLILHMPKFKMRYKMEELKEDLMAMGLEKPFNPSPVNFTQLFANPTESMYISRVIHDALIEVDEWGSEAAAATIVEVDLTSAGPNQPRIFALDKPFVFFIQDNHSGAILFMGKLGNPALL
ncbi:serpin family protein [Lunatibacter salilacus]|uniref:serpin family protein n=1 Tax=Lunatibacter salilacus TaxID=2483804 RepID=UPI00131E9729|nr:serpin family protein [Lunatibacter salilacus]